jgi:hypothetical protein
MSTIWRRSAMLLALYAMALHALLLGFAPMTPGAFALINPFALICHATAPAAAPGQPPPGTLHFIPGRAIDQCNLCSAAEPPPAPAVSHVIPFAWARMLHVLQPVAVPAPTDVTSNPKLSRGPPVARA